MTGWRKYKSRTEELAEARDAGKERFKEYFSNVNNVDTKISDYAILKANLLYCSYQQFMADEEEDSQASLSLKAILDVLNHVRDESILAETTADGQLKIVDLFNQNLAVRRNIMLFKGVCPDALKAIIMRYELDKCESRAGADKAVLIARFRNYLFHRVEPKASLCENFQYYQTDSYGQKIKVKNSVDYLKSWAVAFTPAELKTLKQGRTGRFLEHFCGDNQELFPTVVEPALETGARTLRVGSDFEVEQPSLNPSEVNLLWDSLKKNAKFSQDFNLPEQAVFVNKFVSAQTPPFSIQQLGTLLANPAANAFIECHWSKLGFSFRRSLVEACSNNNFKVDCTRMAGLAVLAYYEHPQQKFVLTAKAGFFSVKEQPLKEAKKEGVKLLRDYLQTGICDIAPDKTTNTDPIGALQDGRLGALVKNFAGEWKEGAIVREGINKMADSSPTFNACLSQFKIAQQNQRDSVLGRFKSYSNPHSK